MKAGTYNVAAKDIEKNFEDRTGSEVDILAFPFTVLEQKNQTDLVTQTGQYDAISNSSWDVAFFEHLLPLDEYIQADNFEEGYVKGLFEPGPTNFYNGKPVGVMYSADAYGIFVRTDLFESAGVSPDWETWDDFLQVTEDVAGKLPSNVAPIAFAFGAPEQVPGIFGGAYEGTYLTSEPKWQVEAEPAIRALEITQEVARLGPENALGLSIDEANAMFLEGDAAVLIGWPSFIRGALNDPKQSKLGDRWALTRFPGPGFPWLSNWNWSISKYSSAADASWDWITAYTNPENAKKWMFKYGIGSPFESTYTDPKLLDKYANDLPQQKENLARSLPAPLTFEAFDAQFRILGDMLTGELSPAATVREWHREWSDMPIPEALVQMADAMGFVA